MHDPAIVVMLLPKFILSLLFGAGGAYLFFLGLTGVLRKWRLLVNAASTSGTVVAYDAVLRMSTDDRGRDEEITYYYPIVEFMDSIGMERRATVSKEGNSLSSASRRKYSLSVLIRSSRSAIVSVILFFLVGGFLLSRVDVTQGRAAVHVDEPVEEVTTVHTEL